MQISSILMSRSIPVQTVLYSLPLVNIITRLYQHSHSIDDLKVKKQLNPEGFSNQQSKFSKGRTYGTTIQAICGLAIRCLLPSSPLIGSIILASALGLAIYHQVTQLPQVRGVYKDIDSVFMGF